MYWLGEEKNVNDNVFAGYLSVCSCLFYIYQEKPWEEVLKFDTNADLTQEWADYILWSEVKLNY